MHETHETDCDSAQDGRDELTSLLELALADMHKATMRTSHLELAFMQVDADQADADVPRFFDKALRWQRAEEAMAEQVYFLTDLIKELREQQIQHRNEVASTYCSADPAHALAA